MTLYGAFSKVEREGESGEDFGETESLRRVAYLKGSTLNWGCACHRPIFAKDPAPQGPAEEVIGRVRRPEREDTERSPQISQFALLGLLCRTLFGRLLIDGR
jgi:hypothetical protein